MRFLPVNLDSLLVELDDLPQTLALLDSLQTHPVPGVEEVIPAARTLLLSFRPAAISAAQLARALQGRELGGRRAAPGKVVEIPVVYDGEDLAEVAQLLGISTQEVIARHTGGDYTVAFCGFAPGFAYLSGGHPSFRIPRRATPRTRIPAGAVALAGEFSGIYPQASPGGWQIIGVTPLKMWDIDRAEAALLQPGYRVRFVDAGRLAVPISPPAAAIAPQQRPAATATQLEVIAPSLQATLQDLGRPGQAGQGISASGALDRAALRSANRLVGNAVDSACLEVLHGGLRLRSRGHTVLAVTGAQTPLTIQTARGQTLRAAAWQTLALDDGDVLGLAAPEAGLRAYVAVRGGFAVKPVLGSLATDTLARVGPAPLAAGDLLPVGDAPAGAVALREAPAFPLPGPGAVVTLDVVLGPRTDWFTPQAVALLQAQPWRVTPQSNRIGIRLEGAQPLARRNHAELPSEGTVAGAIQVPASGQPVLFLADHPLTGGYPVIGAVASHHLDLAGQIPVGAQIRFNPIAPFRDIVPQEAKP